MRSQGAIGPLLVQALKTCQNAIGQQGQFFVGIAGMTAADDQGEVGRKIRERLDGQQDILTLLDGADMEDETLVESIQHPDLFLFHG